MAVKLWTTLVLPIRTVQYGHSNLGTPIWRDQNGLSELTRSAQLQQLDSPYWTGRISLLVLVSPYWSNQFAAYYTAKSL